MSCEKVSRFRRNIQQGNPLIITNFNPTSDGLTCMKKRTISSSFHNVENPCFNISFLSAAFPLSWKIPPRLIFALYGDTGSSSTKRRNFWGKNLNTTYLLILDNPENEVHRKLLFLLFKCCFHMPQCGDRNTINLISWFSELLVCWLLGDCVVLV